MGTLGSIVAGALLLGSGAADAQKLKPGLWEMTTTRRFQQAPTALMLETVRTYTSSACVVQGQVDRYGAMLPPREPGCEVAAINHSGDTTRVSLVCRGQAFGTMNIEVHAIDEGHATSKTHFISTIPEGSHESPVEYSIENRWIWQRASCGEVKPLKDYPF